MSMRLQSKRAHFARFARQARRSAAANKRYEQSVRTALDILDDPGTEPELRERAREFLGLTDRRLAPEYIDATMLTDRVIHTVRVR